MQISVLNLDNAYSSLAIEFCRQGISVVGYDTNVKLKQYFDPQKVFSNFTFTTSLKKSVKNSDYVFVLYETTTKMYYDGSSPLGNKPLAGQDYSELSRLFIELNDLLTENQKVVLIGNVAPKTCRELQNLILKNKLLYFVVANTFETIKISSRESFKYTLFEDPETFLYLGTNLPMPSIRFHGGTGTGGQRTILDEFERDFPFLPAVKLRRVYQATWEEVELLNMFCRSWDALQNTFVNTMQHMCAKVGADSTYITRRIRHHIKKRGVWKTGLGFGYDYPQTLMDMSLLTNELDMGYDIFKEVLVGREKQAKHIASKIVEEGSSVMFGEIEYDTHSMTHNFYLHRTPPSWFNSFIKLIEHYVSQMGAKIVEDIKEADVYVSVPNDKFAKSLENKWLGRIFDIEKYYGRPIENDFSE